MRKKPIVNNKLSTRSKEILTKDSLFVSPSYTRGHNMVVDSGKGMWITDTDGNRYLDFTAGIAVCSTGHCHPKVVKAIKKQADKLIHMSGTDFYYELQVNLAERLSKLRGIPAKVYFGNSGAEAVEAAFKLARWHRNRPLNIAFSGAFHGRTMGALSLTGSKSIQKDQFHPLVPQVYHFPYAYCYRCPYNKSAVDCNMECVEAIHEAFNKYIPANQVAAIFVEPIQGEGGYIVPPKKFLEGLKSISEEHGILLVFDEVQAGMGRTGKMFAYEHFGVQPDILTLAKGIASGMPLGATIALDRIMSWPPGSHASTFGGNPISCAAALTTIDLLENELIENASYMGRRLIWGLSDLEKSYEFIGNVRGSGLMIGMEIVKGRETKEKWPKIRDRIVDKAFEKGLLLLSCGETSIRFSPPLVVNSEEIDTCLSILEDVFKDILKSL